MINFEPFEEFNQSVSALQANYHSLSQWSKIPWSKIPINIYGYMEYYTYNYIYTYIFAYMYMYMYV